MQTGTAIPLEDTGMHLWVQSLHYKDWVKYSYILWLIYVNTFFVYQSPPNLLISKT